MNTKQCILPIILLISILLGIISPFNVQKQAFDYYANKDSTNLVVNLGPSIDGVINAGEYDHTAYSGGDFVLYYTILRDTISFGLIGRSATGWVSVGFGGTGSMTNYDVYTGGFDNAKTQAFLYDSFSARYAVPTSDRYQNVIEFNSTETNGDTHLEFSRKLNTGDLTNDREIIPGNSISVIMALHRTMDDVTYFHDKAQRISSIIFQGPPSAPQDLISSSTRSQVVLNWITPAGDGGSAISQYRIYRSDNNGNSYTLVDTTTTNSYTDTSITTGVIYNYKITAMNFNGESGDSNVIIDLPLGLVTPPTSFKGDSVSGKVLLDWLYPSDDGGVPVVSYNIYRSMDNLTYDVHYTVDNTQLQFNDTDVINGKTYYYRIAAVNQYNESSLTSTIAVTPLGEPSVPENIQIINGDNIATLSWDSPQTDGGFVLTNYTIYRSQTQDSGFQKVGTNTTTLGFVDNTVLNGEIYYYAVTALNSYGESQFSPIQMVTIANTPLSTALFAVSGNAHVNLTWNAADGRGFVVDNYTIYRSSDGLKYNKLVTVTNTNYQDLDVTNGMLYYYRVTSSNVQGESPYSNPISSTPAGLPSAPQNVTLTTYNTDMILKWDMPVENGGIVIQHYEIYKSADGVNFSRLGTSFGTFYNDSQVQKNEIQYYKIAAINDKGSGPNSSIVKGIITEHVDTPTYVTALFENSTVYVEWDLNTTIIQLNFDAVNVAYNIYRTKIQGLSYELVGTSNQSVYLDTDIEFDTHYYYVVTLVDKNFESSFSNIAAVSTFTTPSSPINIVGIQNGLEIYFNWQPGTDKSSKFNYYTIYKSDDNETYLPLANVTSIYFTDSEIVVNSTYYYYITASNDFGESEPSEIVEVFVADKAAENSIVNSEPENQFFNNVDLGNIINTSITFFSIGIIGLFIAMVAKLRPKNIGQ